MNSLADKNEGLVGQVHPRGQPSGHNPRERLRMAALAVMVIRPPRSIQTSRAREFVRGNDLVDFRETRSPLTLGFRMRSAQPTPVFKNPELRNAGIALKNAGFLRRSAEAEKVGEKVA
jgi:hypothetical protein